MNATDRRRIAQVRKDADALMNSTGNGITTSDVVESLLGDLALIEQGQEPHHVRDLAAQDGQADTEPPAPVATSGAKHYRTRTTTKTVHIGGCVGTLCGQSYSDLSLTFVETGEPASCKRCLRSAAAESTKW